MGRFAARMRSLLTLGLADRIEAMHASTLGLHERLQRIEDDIVALRSIIRTRDDRAQKKLKAALTSLVNVIAILPELDIKGVIPPFPHQGFEITGEEAAFFFHLIRWQRPKLIMELGSGSSTVLFAAALRANGGNGRIISIEHDSAHAERTNALIEQAGLSDRVELVLAPLADMSLGGHAFHWYDIGRRLDTLAEKIDFLFVDGPPGKMQTLARFPAMPMLARHLSPRALVIVDDGAREDEMRMVELWRELDEVDFETETLDFLPHAPMLLTISDSEARVAELRIAREGRPDEAGDDAPLFSQGRRSGTS